MVVKKSVALLLVCELSNQAVKRPNIKYSMHYDNATAVATHRFYLAKKIHLY